MLYKEDIKELLEDLEYNYIMIIHYKGFEGRGINGVNNNTMRLKNINANEMELVHTYGSDTTYRINLNDFVLKENYIKAKYTVYSRSRYSDGFVFDNTYSIVVPYDSITSIKIVKIS